IVVLLPFTVSGIADLPEWMRSFAQLSGFIAIAGIIILVIAANQRERASRMVGGLIGRFLPFLDRDSWVRRFDNLLVGLKSLTSIRDGLILTILTILVWIPIIIAYYFTMLAVNLEPTWIMAAFVVCAAALSVAIPSTPGQAGPFHFAVITALQLYGQPAAESASFAFLYHIGALLVMVIMGTIGVFSTGVTFGNVIRSAQSFASRQGTNQP
ncbi:MAG TPA: lysylphosphatidylglycerol synthase transmembrane domain-containing protein, partial [Promineifilum sp.]|nr:lysylphosphatidylglycerol synthase transmembrane domain-containing protein [Promineifilum sp.]